MLLDALGDLGRRASSFSNARFGLPTAARMRSMSSRMGCAVWCANMSASMTSASVASAAPPSTITIASLRARDDQVDVGLRLLLERRDTR